MAVRHYQLVVTGGALTIAQVVLREKDYNYSPASCGVNSSRPSIQWEAKMGWWRQFWIMRAVGLACRKGAPASIPLSGGRQFQNDFVLVHLGDEPTHYSFFPQTASQEGLEGLWFASPEAQGLPASPSLRPSLQRIRRLLVSAPFLMKAGDSQQRSALFIMRRAL